MYLVDLFREDCCLCIISVEVIYIIGHDGTVNVRTMLAGPDQLFQKGGPGKGPSHRTNVHAIQTSKNVLRTLYIPGVSKSSLCQCRGSNLGCSDSRTASTKFITLWDMYTVDSST